MSDLVTIAIPAYKNSFLAEAVESALAQDYSNIELIIVNDKSPYDLDAIVSKYDDSRIRYYVNEENLGKRSIVLNWNRCLEYARGDFFVLLCDDDVLMPNFVSELMKLARKYPQCNVFHGRRNLINEGTGKVKEDDVWPEYEDFNSFVQNELRGKRAHTVSEFMYRTAHVKDMGYAVYPVGYFSDNASVLMFGKESGFVSSDKILCTFRMSDENITGSANKYVIEKTRAAIQYYTWLHTFTRCFIEEKRVYETIDAWVYNWIFKPANIWGRIKIIFVMPYTVWGFKQKMYMLFSVIFSRG